MTYEYREGLNRIRVELAGDVVSLVQRSPDGSSSFTFPLADLSPTPAFAKQRDGALKSALVLCGVVAFAAIIVISMVRFSIGWSTFAVASVVLLGSIAAGYFLTPIRRYAIFQRSSGVQAFSLKSRSPESEFDVAVASLSLSIAASKKSAQT